MICDGALVEDFMKNQVNKIKVFKISAKYNTFLRFWY